MDRTNRSRGREPNRRSRLLVGVSLFVVAAAVPSMTLANDRNVQFSVTSPMPIASYAPSFSQRLGSALRTPRFSLEDEEDEEGASDGGGGAGDTPFLALGIGALGAGVAAIVATQSKSRSDTAPRPATTTQPPADDDDDDDVVDDGPPPDDTVDDDDVVDDGPPPDDTVDTTPFETDEYNNQHGLGQANAAFAYARGMTGQGTVVAFLDDGYDVNHPEFDGQIVHTLNVGTGTEDVAVEDHGTHVAGIVAAKKDDTEMHGIAPDAQLALYSFDFSLAQAATAYEDMVTQAEGGMNIVAVNNSWGYDVNVNNVLDDPDFATGPFVALANNAPGSAAEWEAMVDALLNLQQHAVVVWAMANVTLGDADVSGALPLVIPDLESHWIVVVNVDQNNQLQSQGCGSAKDFCLAAPGTDIYSTLPGGNYGNLTGTSMAAPHVAGAIALLSSEGGLGLSPKESRDRLLLTADKTFDGYNEDDHGQGLLDLDAATRPLTNSLRVITGSDRSVDDDGREIGETYVVSGGAFGDSLVRAVSEQTIAAFDVGNGAFRFNMAGLVTEYYDRVDSLHVLQRLRTEQRSSFRTAVEGFGEITMTMLPAKAERLGADNATQELTDAYTFGLNNSSRTEQMAAMSYRTEEGAWLPNTSFGFGYHRDSEGLLSSLGPDVAYPFAYSLGAFSAPHFGLVEEGFTAFSEISLSDRTQLRVNMIGGEVKQGSLQHGELDSTAYGAFTTITHELIEGVRIGLEGGSMFETGSVLGSALGGAFEHGSTAGTLFAGAHVELSLLDGWSLYGSYHHGWTNIGIKEGTSLFSAFDRIQSQSAALGLVGRNVLSADDRFGIMVSQPLRVERGAAHMLIPVFRDWDGNVLTETVEAALSPSGRETRFEAVYDFAFSANTRIKGMAGYRLEADHIAVSKDEATFLLRLDHRF